MISVWDRKPVPIGFVAATRVFFPYQSVEKRGQAPRTMSHSNGFFMLVGASPRFSTDCYHRGITWSYSIGPPGRWLPASEERLPR